MKSLKLNVLSKKNKQITRLLFAEMNLKSGCVIAITISLDKCARVSLLNLGRGEDHVKGKKLILKSTGYAI